MLQALIRSDTFPALVLFDHFNSLRTVVAYMHQGNKLDYHVQTNQYNFATLYPTNLKSHFVQYTLPKILMYWAERNNQPKAEKSYQNT